MTQRFRVLVTHDLYDNFLQQLEHYGPPDCEWLRCQDGERDEIFYQQLVEADCLITRRDLSERDYASARRLRLLQLPIAGFDQIDLQRAKAHGVWVSNNGGANAISVAEHFVLMVLALYRRVFHHHETVRDGGFVNLKAQNREMFGKTLGIIGMGNVGRMVAQRALAFGMTVLFYDIRDGLAGFDSPNGCEGVELDHLLATADVVSFHVPLTQRTRGMINRELLAKLRSDALLLNLARGEIQDEQALFEALRVGRIAGLGLDVFSQEPPPVDWPLLQLDPRAGRVVFAPHAGPSQETRLRVAEHVASNCARVARGEPPIAQVIDYEELG